MLLHNSNGSPTEQLDHDRFKIRIWERFHQGFLVIDILISSSYNSDFLSQFYK